MKTLSLLFCLFALVSNAQDIRTYIKQNTVPIRSVSPADTSFDDLAALGAAIGDARIVMLGEQDHAMRRQAASLQSFQVIDIL